MASVNQIKRDIETYRAVLQDEQRALAALRGDVPGDVFRAAMNRVERAGWVVVALAGYLREVDPKNT
jgi:hypothetical protein